MTIPVNRISHVLIDKTPWHLAIRSSRKYAIDLFSIVLCILIEVQTYNWIKEKERFTMVHMPLLLTSYNGLSAVHFRL